MYTSKCFIVYIPLFYTFPHQMYKQYITVRIPPSCVKKEEVQGWGKLKIFYGNVCFLFLCFFFFLITFTKKSELKRCHDIQIVQFPFLYRMKTKNLILSEIVQLGPFFSPLQIHKIYLKRMVFERMFKYLTKVHVK